MGLEDLLQRKFNKNEEDNPRDAYKKAQELKEKQEIYEAEQQGRHSELLKQAAKRGAQKVKGGSGFDRALTGLGEFGVGMGKGLHVTDMFSPPPPKKKPQTRGTVVHVHVHGGGRVTQEEHHKKKKQGYRNPIDIRSW